MLQEHYRQSRKTKRVANVLNVRSLAGSVETHLEQVCVLSSHRNNGDQATQQLHILHMLDLIWGFGKSCKIICGITSHPANVFSNVEYEYSIWYSPTPYTLRVYHL